MAIDRRGQILVRANYENKISCHFNMSRLQAEFTLHSLSKEDAKHYGLHVEFVLARAPLMDTVILRVEGKYLVEITDKLMVCGLEEVT